MDCLIKSPIRPCETESAVKKVSFKFSLSLWLMAIAPLWWIISGLNCDSNKHLPCSAVKVYSITVYGPRGRKIDQNITSSEFIGRHDVMSCFREKSGTFQRPPTKLWEGKDFVYVCLFTMAGCAFPPYNLGTIPGPLSWTINAAVRILLERFHVTAEFV